MTLVNMKWFYDNWTVYFRTPCQFLLEMLLADGCFEVFEPCFLLGSWPRSQLSMVDLRGTRAGIGATIVDGTRPAFGWRSEVRGRILIRALLSFFLWSLLVRVFHGIDATFD